MSNFLSITKSEVFNFLNQTADANGRIKELIANARKVAVQTGVSHIHNIDDIMNDRDVLLQKAIKAWDNGEINLLFAKDVALGNSVMFIPGPNMIRTNVTMFCKEEETVVGGATLYNYKFTSVSILKEILCMSYVCLEFSRNFQKYVLSNFGLRKRLLEVYNLMFLNVLSRISGIAANKDNAPVVKYILTKFFHNVLLDLKSVDIDGVCQNIAGISSTEQRAKVEGIKLKYGEDITSFEQVLTILKESFPQLAKVDMTFLIKTFTFTFTAVSVMCVDYVPYLAALCESARHGFGVYQSRKIKTEIGKEALMAGMDIISAIDK